jgi:hypothetical protein
MIATTNQISMASICELPSLQAFRPSILAVCAACQSSPKLSALLVGRRDFIPGGDPNALFFPFVVDPTTLHIKDIPYSITHAKISSLLATICGGSQYRIWREQTGVRVEFDASVELFAVWIALAYCPIDGVLLDAELAWDYFPGPKGRDQPQRGKKFTKGRRSPPPHRQANGEVRLRLDDFPPLSVLG